MLTMTIQRSLKHATWMLVACPLLAISATPAKKPEQSPEAQGTYAEPAAQSIVSGTTQSVPPLLEKMRPVTQDMINSPVPEGWLSWRRNPQAWGRGA